MSDSAPAETAAATGVQLEIDGPTSQMPLLSLGKPETGNGLRLKKGTLWGPPDLNAKAGGKPGPPLGVQGRSFEGKDGASPASEGSRQSPRPPSSSPSLAAAARTGVRSPSKRESGGLQPTQNGHPPRSGGPVHLQARHSEISSVVLTLDSPVGGPIAHRRLQPSPHQLKQQALAAGRSQQQSPTKPSGPGGVRLFDGGAGPSGIGAPVGGPQSQVMRIDSSVPDGGGASGGYPRDLELPESIPPGGEDEIAWLRMRLTEGLSRNEQLVAQLQRVQQESLGLRSTLIAQQGAKPAAAAAADGAEDQLGSLGTGTPRGVRAAPRLARASRRACPRSLAAPCSRVPRRACVDLGLPRPSASLGPRRLSTRLLAPSRLRRRRCRRSRAAKAARAATARRTVSSASVRSKLARRSTTTTTPTTRTR